MRTVSKSALIGVASSVLAWGAASPATATTAADVGGCAGTVPTRTLSAGPTDYRTVLSTLVAGDRLLLDPGTYTQGLPFSGHNGSADNCIVVEGPDVWPPTAVFTVRTCCNTLSIRDSSYLVVRNIEIDGTGDTVSADGVKAEAGGPDASDYAHHITLERLLIHDHDFSQQTVCISTKVPAWNWVIRDNVLDTCGTGMYLGNSNGAEEFVAGLIEHNLVIDSIGYNAQIKHQNARDTALGQPADGDTIIRHNVFSKGANSSTAPADVRPNLLVGHWPLSGTGSDDDYLIYGNFFYRNPTGVEALFQGEGNVIFYDNLLVNPDGPAVFVQAQNDVPRRVRIFQNTVVAAGTGLSITGADTVNFEQWLVGNAVFSPTPLNGGTTVADNVTDTQAAASGYLTLPSGTPGVDLDLYPLANAALQGVVGTSGLEGFEDWDRDFDGTHRGTSYRGAYAGEGANPGWALALTRKPESAPPPTANLYVTKSDGRAAVFPGQLVEYLVTASNAGPDAVAGASVSDTLPAELVGASWTCSGSGGGTCAASGTGDIADSVDLPVGASVQYRLAAQVSASATTSVANTASVTVPAGTTEVSPADNSATDTDAVNAAVAAARFLMPGQAQDVTLAPGAATAWWRTRLTAGRSYAVYAWAPAAEASGALPDLAEVGFFTDAGATAAAGVATADDEVDIALPGFAQAQTKILPQVSGEVFVELSAASTPSAPYTVRVMLLETTLFSPWWFVSSAAGYESFVEVRNNSATSVTATVSARASDGAVVGSTSLVVPGNGTALVAVGADLGGGDGFGSVEIAHSGAPGAISANTTTLSAATGLSFDAPFSARMDWSTLPQD